MIGTLATCESEEDPQGAGSSFSAMEKDPNANKKTLVTEILPKSGLVYSEKGGFAEILCKPKILPLKSGVLDQLQAMESAQDELITSETRK